MSKTVRFVVFVMVALILLTGVVMGSLWLEKMCNPPPVTEFIEAESLQPEYCAEFLVSTAEPFWMDGLHEPAENKMFTVSSDFGDYWCIYGADDLEVDTRGATEVDNSLVNTIAGLCVENEGFAKIVVIDGSYCNFSSVQDTGPDVDDDGDGYSEEDGDCNDLNKSIHPGREEICDYEDTNCDGKFLDDEVDMDGDGFSICMGDCDDNDPAVNPSMREKCNGIDDDCDPETDEKTDFDGDGFTACQGDCYEGSSKTYPGAPEIVDGKDTDCDGHYCEEEKNVIGCSLAVPPHPQAYHPCQD